MKLSSINLRNLSFLLAALIMCACSGGDDSDLPSNNNPLSGGPFIYSYNFTVDGGDLEGKTYKRTFDAPEGEQTLFKKKNKTNFGADLILFAFKDELESHGNTVKLTAQLLVDDDKNPIEFSNDGDGSTSELVFEITPGSGNSDNSGGTYALQAKSGSFSFQELDIGDVDQFGVAPVQFVINFDGTFEFNNNQSLQEVQVSGTLRSYEK